MSRSHLCCCVAAASFMLGVPITACSSAVSPPSGAATTRTPGAFETCFVGRGGTCSREQRDEHQACILAKCDAPSRQCYGETYLEAQFSGPCAPMAECIQRCDCGDDNCISGCVRDGDRVCDDCLQQHVSAAWTRTAPRPHVCYPGTRRRGASDWGTTAAKLAKTADDGAVYPQSPGQLSSKRRRE